MASKSLMQKAVLFVSRGIAPVVQPLGFRRCAPHYLCAHGDLYHCIHFQGSQWGSADHGKFTINLAVTGAALYTAYTGKPLPANPATVLWPIQERIGFFLPGRRDHWWSVDADTDLDALAEEVSSALGSIVAGFFARFADSDALLQLLGSGASIPGLFPAHRPIVLATLLAARGEHEQAATCLREAQECCTISAFGSTYPQVAARLGLRHFVA